MSNYSHDPDGRIEGLQKPETDCWNEAYYNKAFIGFIITFFTLLLGGAMFESTSFGQELMEKWIIDGRAVFLSLFCIGWFMTTRKPGDRPAQNGFLVGVAVAVVAGVLTMFFGTADVMRILRNGDYDHIPPKWERRCAAGFMMSSITYGVIFAMHLGNGIYEKSKKA